MINVDRFVQRQNLQNFRKQLAESKDDAQHKLLTKLLAEEESKDPKPDSGE